MGNLFFVLLVASSGYFTFKILRFPVPAILGSLFFSAALNLSGFFPEISLLRLSWFSNIVIGSYVGLKVNRTSVRFLRDLPFPALIVSLGMLVISLASGSLLYLLSDLSPATAYMGSTAGGISEMALLSISFGADVAAVSLLQVFRLLTAIIATPIFCKKWTDWYTKRERARFPGPSPLPETIPSSNDEDDAPAISSSVHPSASGYILFAAVALAGGYTGYALHLPVGILTGSMFAVAVMNLAGKELPPMPPVLRTMAQIGIGIIIASSITMETFRQFSTMALPVVCLTAGMLAASLSLGFLLHKMTGWDYPTCLLSTSLGGLSQMSIISEEMGADPLKVSILQTVRLLSILIVLPFLFTFLFN